MANRSKLSPQPANPPALFSQEHGSTWVGPAHSLAWSGPVILLLAALLRFYHLAGQSLWADEGNSVALTHYSLAEITQRAALDIHPPFYYWLLKGWIIFFSDSEIGLRSLSAVLGVGLVYMVARLGNRLFNRRIGRIAAFVTAVSPLQIYYAQEARMYMLLALLGVLTVLAALLVLDGRKPRFSPWPARLLYILVVTAGLYTHYAYPLIPVAVNIVALAWLWQKDQSGARPPTLAGWLVLQGLPLLAYLPWLPTAWRQLTTWPAERPAVSLAPTLETISNTLLVGLSWPFPSGFLATAGVAFILLLTLLIAREQPSSLPTPYRSLPLLWAWFLLPVILTLIIFTPAFLKFLLVAAPPLALLIAVALDRLAFSQQAGRLGYLASSGFLLLLSSASAISLYYYYTDATYARDNYRGIAGFIQAAGGPQDAVILNAEGQQDVFNYYYRAAGEAPVYPLPRQRPLDEAATLAELEAIGDRAEKIYAVYWAAHQADPTGLIEGWLNTHLFKATDQWYGNVRLVSYASPRTTGLALTPAGSRLGPHIHLTGYALTPTPIAPGDILQVALEWTTAEPEENYTVFVQVLDEANHLVGQRDAPPLTPVSGWPVEERIADRHGILIEPGTPPGRHRVIAGLYHSQTGRRLPVYTPGSSGAADFIELGEIEVIRPAITFPPEAFDIQTRVNISLPGVTLLGYDLYKTGYRSTPDVPLHPGDLLHFVAYWQRQVAEPVPDNQLWLQVVTAAGVTTPVSLNSSPAGTAYPIQEWQPEEIIRGQYDLFLSDLAPGTYRLALTLGGENSSPARPGLLTGPFKVE